MSLLDDEQTIVDSHIPYSTFKIVFEGCQTASSIICQKYDQKESDLKNINSVIIDFEELPGTATYRKPNVSTESIIDEESPDAHKYIADLLGAYYPCKGKIVIYYKQIDKQATDKKNLVTITLIHEFMHALMRVKKNRYGYDSMYYHWREESLANALTLQAIDNSGYRDLLCAAKSFMNTQTKEYKYGRCLFDKSKNDLEKLRKEWIDEKNSQCIAINKQLQWLEEAKTMVENLKKS